MTDENPIQRVGEGQAGPSAAERLAREILAPMIEDAEDVRMPLGVAKRMSVPAVTAIIATALRASEASVEIGTRQNRALAEEVESLRDEVEALAGTIRRITEASGAARAEATKAEALMVTVAKALNLVRKLESVPLVPAQFDEVSRLRLKLIEILATGAAIRAPRPPEPVVRKCAQCGGHHQGGLNYGHAFIPSSPPPPSEEPR